MQLKIAAIYAGLNILLLLALAFLTGRARTRRKVLLGDGGDAEVLRAIRVHANAAEYIPAGLVGVTLLALLAPATPMWLLHAAGGSLTAGRIIHAFGLTHAVESPGRFVGAVLTALSFAIMGVGLIWLGFTDQF